MADEYLPLYVIEVDDGWEVRAREGDAVVSKHEMLRDGDESALWSLTKLDEYTPKEKRFEDGVWRWIDMTAVEDEPASDGSQVTERGIRCMAARLNAGDPIMIDGGSDDSGAHESLQHTDTRANGWVHVGVEVEHIEGDSKRLHLWGLAEVLPEIAADMDANRLALGSIGFVTKRKPSGLKDNDDATLVQHALTNIPAVQGLTPAGTPRSRITAIAFRTRPITPRDVMGAKTKDHSQRGPAADALAQVYKIMEIDPTSAYAAWDLLDKIHATHADAASEAISEAQASASAPADESAGKSKVGAKTKATKRSSREGEGEHMDKVKELLGLAPEATDEEVIAAIEKLKGGSDEATGEDSTGKSRGELAASRAANEELRTQVAVLTTEVASLRHLRDEKAKREREDKVVGALVKRGIDTPERRAKWLSHAEKFGVDSALSGIEDAHVPPTGSVIVDAAPAAARSSGAPEGGADDEGPTDAQIEKAKKRAVELKKDYPNDPGHVLFARAMKEVRGARPN